MRSHRKALKTAGKHKPKPAGMVRPGLTASQEQPQNQTGQGDLPRFENEGGSISPVLTEKVSHRQASQETL